MKIYLKGECKKVRDGDCNVRSKVRRQGKYAATTERRNESSYQARSEGM